MASARTRRDSIESTASGWEKISEVSPQTLQDAPFAEDQNNDLLEENSDTDHNEDYSIGPDLSPPILTNLSLAEQSKPWEYPTRQNCLRFIINNQQNSHNIKQRLRADLSKRGLSWTKEEEKERSWHFGLSSLQVDFVEPRLINIQMVCLSSSIPFWITLAKEKQQDTSKTSVSKLPISYKFTSDFTFALCYGALTDVNDFYYSPQHSWTNEFEQNVVCFLSLCEQRNGGARFIQWMIENSEKRREKKLFITNINRCVIIHLYEDGFEIYICQSCNMHEYEAMANNSQQNSKNYRSRSSSRKRGQNYRHSQPQPPPPLSTKRNECHQPRQISYERYRRIGTRNDCYFPTVLFSLRVNPMRSSNQNGQRKPQMQIKEILSSVIHFFLEQKITVCYGSINSNPGSNPYLFFQPTIPHFPSLIMKYSWQMLSIVGYRLQLQIHANNRFLEELHELSGTRDNPDELFYRVCVYLSRVFSLKPFVDITDELQHAISESIQKRADSAYGLVRKIDTEKENEAYIPSVTITPTTIRIKPLKLCRTNRVIREHQKFGTPVDHFVLVDVRDENGRCIQSYDFRDLRQLLLDYLEHGFILMDDDRTYQYLHHSQSQLRERQFWFYHHDKSPSNLSFPKAYQWMGNFDNESNPAKYAARMALCFSTTKATVTIPTNNTLQIDDITINIGDKKLCFTDGCGKMSEKLRDDIKNELGVANKFSAVQFRYGGIKGVVSLDTRITDDKDLHFRPSMKKFTSDHQIFEVCKLSAPRPLHLNRQAILLLSYRQISDASFLILQQQNHLQLIRALLRNSDAEKMILEKIPSWFLPRDIDIANIDYIREPFFRQLLISVCLQATRELLRRTRIRIPRDEARNMIGIVDEYNVLKPDQVFVQYTVLDDQLHKSERNKTKILDKRKVVITKNPCHHPGDIRTFTAVDHPRLRHLKDVIVFSQQGDHPAPHAISGSDLDGDEYLVIWYETLVPLHTDNAQPYDYDAPVRSRSVTPPITREHIHNIILEIAEQDCLGRLSNLHLAFADKFGVDNDQKPPHSKLSTIALAGAISQEVDSGKTGFHPLNGDDIRTLNTALGDERPDYTDNLGFKQYKSDHVLGKLYRASKGTLPQWNRLVRYHRHLRHLQIRTRVDDEETEDEEGNNNDETTNFNLDLSIINGVDRDHQAYHACAEFADKLAAVYRQEIFEILNLYGLAHESDLWCRNSINGLSGELEDTAYTELEQLATRTRTRFFNEAVIYCETGCCHSDSSMSEMCLTCQRRQQSTAVACYYACYGREHALEQAPILSLPWLFATPLLHNRITNDSPPCKGLLSIAIQETLGNRRQLKLRDQTLQFRAPQEPSVREVTVPLTVCAFIEVLLDHLGRKNYPNWPLVLNHFIQKTVPGELSDQWTLVLGSHRIDEYNEYAALLKSLDWTNTEDELLHDYFQKILDICFEEGRRTNDIRFLDISKDIIHLLQKMAINLIVQPRTNPV